METKKVHPPPGEQLLGSKDRIGDALEEAAEHILKEKCRKGIQKARENVSLIKPSPVLPEGQVHDLLTPESKKSHFIEFREQFSEDMFFKKPKLGKVYPLQTKPDSLTNENFTYGIQSLKSGNLYDLILPKRSAEEINREYINWHDKYVISHGHYFPAERIHRSYNEHFDPSKTFGICKKMDTSGRMVRECMQQRSSGLIVINEVQKKFNDRTVGQLGNTTKRCDIVQHNLPPIKPKFNNDSFNVRALLESLESPPQKNAIIEAIGYVKNLRRRLFNHRHFHIDDLKSLLKKYDKHSKGFLDIPTTFKVLRTLQFRTDEALMRHVMIHFKIIQNEGTRNELVNLDLFWKMLHLQYPLPTMPSAEQDLPLNYNNKDTVYRIFCQDRQKASCSSENFNMANHEHKETSAVADCISPNVVVSSGLNKQDFELLRSKEELRQIFRNLLKDNFEDIWENATSKCNGDDSPKMSVNDLIQVIKPIFQN
ncbi:EF-hand domain-containing family member B-like [Musca autumnalis]|uniref:EF-hand domain-containing family member B-like n=1 Tax=Musca autumnalis TaxID=221902 RepID=UPI003CF7AF5E